MGHRMCKAPDQKIKSVEELLLIQGDEPVYVGVSIILSGLRTAPIPVQPSKVKKEGCALVHAPQAVASARCTRDHPRSVVSLAGRWTGRALVPARQML